MSDERITISPEMESFAIAMREHLAEQFANMPAVISLPKSNVITRPTIVVDTAPIAESIALAIADLSKNLADKLKQDMTPIALSISKGMDKPPIVTPITVDLTPIAASHDRMSRAINDQTVVFTAMTRAFDRLAAAMEEANAKRAEPRVAIVEHGEKQSTITLE